MIANVEPGDEGVYTCQIITRLDMAEARGRLTLCGKTAERDAAFVCKWIIRQGLYKRVKKYFTQFYI